VFSYIIDINEEFLGFPLGFQGSPAAAEESWRTTMDVTPDFCHISGNCMVLIEAEAFWKRQMFSRVVGVSLAGVLALVPQAKALPVHNVEMVRPAPVNNMFLVGGGLPFMQLASMEQETGYEIVCDPAGMCMCVVSSGTNGFFAFVDDLDPAILDELTPLYIGDEAVEPLPQVVAGNQSPGISQPVPSQGIIASPSRFSFPNSSAGGGLPSLSSADTGVFEFEDGPNDGPSDPEAPDIATAPLPVPGLLLAAGLGAMALLRRTRGRKAA
jgi:hypothetical protein